MTDPSRFDPPEYYKLFTDDDSMPLEPPAFPAPKTVILGSDTYWNMSYWEPMDMISRNESISEKDFLKQLNDTLFLLMMQYFHEKMYEPEILEQNGNPTLDSLFKVYNNIIRRLNLMREDEANDKLGKIIDERQTECDKLTERLEDIVKVLETSSLEELKERFLK